MLTQVGFLVGGVFLGFVALEFFPLGGWLAPLLVGAITFPIWRRDLRVVAAYAIGVGLGGGVFLWPSLLSPVPECKSGVWISGDCYGAGTRAAAWAYLAAAGLGLAMYVVLEAVRIEREGDS